MSNLIREQIEEYFSSMNPISKRVMEDLNLAKMQQGDKWDKLTNEQQEEVLWKTLVNPVIEKKLEKIKSQTLDMECFPVLRIKPGAKIVVDEDPSGKSFGSTWRDEHSAPFLWETQSQLNLSFCATDVKKDAKDKEVILKPANDTNVAETAVDDKKDDELKRPVAIKRPEVPPPPVPPHATPPTPKRSQTLPSSAVLRRSSEKNETPIYAKVQKRKSSAKTLVISEMKAHQKAKAEMKPAVPPRMSLELKVNVNDPKYRSLDSSDSDGIPKTGFDFLDNW